MSEKAHVLFVDDERRVLTTMRMLFRGIYNTHFADSAQSALDFLQENPVDVIVSDQRMPTMTGVELLGKAKEIRPDAMRILLTGYSDLNAIVGSINEGEIFRFVNKPWSNQDLKDTVAQAVAAARDSREAALEEAQAEPDISKDGVVAASARSHLPAALVLDDDPAVAPAIQQVMGDEYRVVGASTMEEAIKVLEDEAVGVVISDTRVENRSVVSLLHTLKEHNPELISMIVTARADAGMAIELINQGQIYRFITKPLRETQCKIAVSSALNQHRRLSRNTKLHKRYEVQKPVEEEAAAQPALSGGLLSRIRSLRSLVSRNSAS